MPEKRTEKHEAARNSLPEELRPIFDQMVIDYKFATTVHHGQGFCSPIVIAELIAAGWRLTEPGIGKWKKPEPTRTSS